jgi:hypothetical protein
MTATDEILVVNMKIDSNLINHWLQHLMIYWVNTSLISLVFFYQLMRYLLYKCIKVLMNLNWFCLKKWLFVKLNSFKIRSVFLKSTKPEFLKCPAIEDPKYCENLRLIPTKPITTEKQSNYTENSETKSTKTFKTITTTEIELEINSSACLRLSHKLLINSIFYIIFNKF